MVKDKQLFKNFNMGKNWKFNKKKFDSKPFYGNDDNSKYIKTKIKTFKDSIITNFHNKKVPEEKIPYKCLSIIILDSVIKSNTKYYPQTYLDECIYKQQKQKQQKRQQKNYITEELKSDSDSNDESESESNSDSNDESDSESNDK